MSLYGDIPTEIERDNKTSVDSRNGVNSGFPFLPPELSIKCRKLIESYHAIYGYAGLPDMLWLSEARDIIEGHRDLTQIFKAASKSRGAKRANDSLRLIATLVVSLEVLARDFAGWGRQFPAAKREAEKLLAEFPRRPGASLMDFYLYPPRGIRREFANALAPSATEADISRRR